MARLTIVLPLCAGAVLVGQPALEAQTAGPPLPVSLPRIRAALERPPSVLQVSGRSAEIPTFRVEVRQPMWTPEPVEEDGFDPTMGLPSAGELLMGGIGKIGSAVAGYRRGRAQRRARQEVEDALSAFCAVHECPAPETAR